MRYRKTPKNRRETYKLYDDKDNLVAEYRPGIDGVTEVDIANLHKLDDHESYINNKERRLPEWYQGVYDEWRERYITDYKEQYGCKPSEQEIPGGHRIFDYLDTDETEEDNSKEYLQAALAVSDEKEASDVVIRLREIVDGFPETWKKVYQLVLIDGISKAEAGRILNLSDVRIGQLVRKITAKIKNDEKIKKFFS